MPIYSLYIKTHNKTGLKYLGHTIRDPFEYFGSGIRWRRHLAIHGRDISTEIIGQYDTKEALRKNGIAYSLKHNVKEDSSWANLTIEEGQGGGINKGKKLGPQKSEHLANISNALRGKKYKKHTKFNSKLSEYRKSRKGIKRGPYKKTA